jgi:hypothetical protein
MTNLDPLVWSYVILRTAMAIPQAVRAWRIHRQFLWTGALALSDLLAGLFVIGYARAAVRSAVGGWWVALFLYAVVLEFLRLRMMASDLEADDIIQAGLLPWIIIGAVPALGAGLFLVFDVLFPHEWGFGGGVGR